MDGHGSVPRKAVAAWRRSPRPRQASKTFAVQTCSDGGGKHPPNRFEHPQHSSTIGPGDIISIIHWGCVQNILPTFIPTNNCQQEPTPVLTEEFHHVSPPSWRSLRRWVNRTFIKVQQKLGNRVFFDVEDLVLKLLLDFWSGSAWSEMAQSERSSFDSRQSSLHW